MNFELNVVLTEMKEGEIENLKKQLSKISKLRIQDKEEEANGPRMTFSYERKNNYTYLKVEIHGAYNLKILLAIYNVFTYLENLSSHQENWSINVNYFAYFTKQNNFDITVEEKLEWACKFDGEIDIIDLLMTISSRCKGEYTFKKFKEKLASNKKYEHILKNIEAYDKRKIPNTFSEPVVKKFNNVEVIMSSKCHDIDRYFKASEHNNIDVTVIDEYEVDYDYINTDLSTTKLLKYTVIDKDENLFYILDEMWGAGDEVVSRLFFFTDEIKDSDLQKMILLFDK